MRKASSRHDDIRILYIVGSRTDTLFALPGLIAAMRQIARLVGRILAYSCVDEKTWCEECQHNF